METVLYQLRACADPTRLRLLALCARGAFCVSELTDILGQSQPRLSRHLKVLADAGLLERSREGTQAWFSATGAGLGGAALRLVPADDPTLATDARAAARVLAERERAASEHFRQTGAAWDEMRELGLAADTVERMLLDIVTQAGTRPDQVLDIGTGTGRLLELCAPIAGQCLGIDASPAMLALARTRISRPDLANCRVRQADAYRLPFPPARFDLVLMHMVLHHAEDPQAMLLEAARVLRPGGRCVVVDLPEQKAVPAHFRWPGFTPSRLHAMLDRAGLTSTAPTILPGKLTVLLTAATREATPDRGPVSEHEAIRP